MAGIITDVIIAAFLFVALNGHGGPSHGGRKIVSDKNKGLFVLTHEFVSSFLHQVLPTVPISIFLLHVRPEEEVEPMSLYKHCVHILTNWCV